MSSEKLVDEMKSPAMSPLRPPPMVTRCPNHGVDGSIHPQAGSYLYRVLPPEIRQQIFQGILGNHCFHIVSTRKGLRFLFCLAEDGRSHIWYRCWGLHHRNTGHLRVRAHHWDSGDRPTEPTTDGGLLPLLRTCQSIYSEGIEILYSQNIFAFCDQNTLELFTSIVPLQRRAMIRSLHVEFGFDKSYHKSGCLVFPRRIPFPNEAEWLRVWDLIGCLSGLRALLIKLVEPPKFFLMDRKNTKGVPGPKLPAYQDSTFLEPIRALRHVEHVEVFLPEEFRAGERADEVLQIHYQTRQELKENRMTPME